MSTEKESNETSDGKIDCLLCGGFVSIQGGDRARFIDHMSNEHDAKTDCHEILLALSVLNSKEQGYIIKSAGPRLEDIGSGKQPDLSTSFLDKISAGVVPSVGSMQHNSQPPGLSARNLNMHKIISIKGASLM